MSVLTRHSRILSFLYLRKIMVVVFITILFLLLSLYAAANRYFLVWLIPAGLALLMLAVYSVEKFLLLILFLVPLSIQLRFIAPGTPVDIFLPTELMMALVVILVLHRYFNDGFPRTVLKHPLTTLIAISLLWMLITALTGTMPLVSLKAIAARIWFVATFYLLAAGLSSRKGFALRSQLALIAGLVPVAVYHLIRMWKAGILNQQASHITAWPFFNDHTSFGAALSFLIPVSIAILFTHKDRRIRYFAGFASVLFMLALLLSYSRAAWVSMVAASLFALLTLLRVPWKLTAITAFVTLIILVFSWESINIRLQSVNSRSSTELGEHIRSAANITSDASNLERINRWKSALRMASERPLTGWGPGTYQFNYAPYQLSSERTIISTNFGDRGNAHSEYLGAMAESGIPGAIIYFSIVVLSLIMGMKRYYSATDRRFRIQVLALITGILTYAIHGGLNSFLDTDKISAPFWMFIALILFIPEPDKDEQPVQ